MRGVAGGALLAALGQGQSVRFSPRPAGAHDEADEDEDEDEEEGWETGRGDGQ